jgi:carbon monoxide dehydrogenase subunit G
MATVRSEFVVSASPDDVWDVVRDVGNVHVRLVPGFVKDTRLDGDKRTVTFANGLTVTERIVTVDDGARRLAYAAVGGRTTHHNASIEVLPDAGGSRVVWTTDLLPDEMEPAIRALVEGGTRAMTQALAD